MTGGVSALRTTAAVRSQVQTSAEMKSIFY